MKSAPLVVASISCLALMGLLSIARPAAAQCGSQPPVGGNLTNIDCYSSQVVAPQPASGGFTYQTAIAYPLTVTASKWFPLLQTPQLRWLVAQPTARAAGGRTIRSLRSRPR